MNTFFRNYLHKDYKEKAEKHSIVLEQAFSTCYFLMKEHMPDRKFTPCVSELKHLSHKSKGPLQDIFVCIGNTVKEALLEEVSKAKIHLVCL